jgi:5-methylcytosine-specific restriction endonuclease McrA
MKTLVLDKSWMPYRVVPWRDAMSWMFQDRVDVVHTHDETVRSAHDEWLVPSVVRMRAGHSHKSKIVRFSRTGVWNRDNGECQYCGVHVPFKELTLDHIVPRFEGGTTSWTNTVTCCFRCNQKKGHKSLADSGFQLRNRPTKPTTHDVVLRELSRLGDIPEDWKNYL